MEIKKAEVTAEREIITLDGAIPDDLICERLKEASNTHIWSQSGAELPEVLRMVNVPEAIVKRVQLNILHLNGLSTHIFGPQVRPSIEGLRGVMAVSNQVNEAIGLPRSNDLIIRTRRKRPPAEPLQKFVSSALLVLNVSSKSPNFIVLGSGKIDSLEEFYQMLPDGSFLMIHDDNPTLQRGAIHGTYMDTDNPPMTELIVGTDMLHARALNAELASDQKTVINHVLHLKGYGEEIFWLPEYSRGSAKGLFWVAQQRKEDIVTTYKKVMRFFGKGAAMEFRY